jgi:hypothetical protein
MDRIMTSSGICFLDEDTRLMKQELGMPPFRAPVDVRATVSFFEDPTAITTSYCSATTHMVPGLPYA